MDIQVVKSKLFVSDHPHKYNMDFISFINQNLQKHFDSRFKINIEDREKYYVDGGIFGAPNILKVLYNPNNYKDTVFSFEECCELYHNNKEIFKLLKYATYKLDIQNNMICSFNTKLVFMRIISSKLFKLNISDTLKFNLLMNLNMSQRIRDAITDSYYGTQILGVPF